MGGLKLVNLGFVNVGQHRGGGWSKFLGERCLISEKVEVATALGEKRGRGSNNETQGGVCVLLGLLGGVQVRVDGGIIVSGTVAGFGGGG